MIPVVRADGTPRERGLAVGRGLAEQIGRSVSFYERYFAAREVDGAGIATLSAPFLAAAGRTVPDLVEVLRGMAEGADVAFDWLVAANVFEELDPLVSPDAAAKERCTSFVSIGEDRALLGHTEQWMAGDLGCVGVVVDVPGNGEVAVVSPVVASWLPAVGANAAGGAVSVMSLSAADDGEGVPRVLVSRHCLSARDRDDAVRRATLEPRSGGYAYLWAWAADDPLVLETTARSHAVVGSAGHANHYVDPGLASVASAPSASSMSRFERICALVETGPPREAGAAMALLADHDSEPNTICRHPDPADGEEADCVVFGMVVDLAARELWVADGAPCEGKVERFSIDELLREVGS